MSLSINTYAKITEHNNGFSNIAGVNGMRPYDGGITGEYYSPLRWGGITGGMVLKILPPVVQHGLKIPREGAFLAQGCINAPPHQQRVTSIGVGSVSIAAMK